MVIILKVLSLFSGIGSFEKALENLGINFEIINYCEIDDNASLCYEAIHGVSKDKRIKDIQDIQIDQLPDFDLLVWGSPCTSFSTSGGKKGCFWTCLNPSCNHKYNPLIQLDLLKDFNICPVCNSSNIGRTPSSLLVYGLEILKIKRPAYSVFENVEGFKKIFKIDFKHMEDKLEQYGYTNHTTTINAEKFGLSQHRSRCFVISIRNDISKNFLSPIEKPLSECPPLSKYTLDIFNNTQ